MKIRPFAAVRPNKADAPLVASVPYDVVSTAEAKALVEGNPKSFLHVSRPEIDLPSGTECSSPAAYEQARRKLDEFLADGTLIKEEEPKYYAYRQIMGGHSQTGIVACFDVKEYLGGVLKQHEKTRQDKEDDRTRHIETLGAQTGPVFLAYRDDKAIDEFVFNICRTTEPIYDFTADDGVRHTVWEIGSASSCMADELTELFERIPCAYIADGHHRSAAAARYAAAHGFEGEARWFMGVIFPVSQLKIFPYNRVVKDLCGYSEYQFLSEICNNFSITESEVVNERFCKMYMAGKWRTLSWEKPNLDDPVATLDVSYLQDNLLAPILRIEDPRTDKRISFIGGLRGEKALSEMVDKGNAAVAFSMNEVSAYEMMAIADAGKVMPPKSTWFEPKLRSGLFVHLLR